LGQVDALVNCAGITFYGRTLEASMAECLRIIAVNQVATMQCTMLFLRYFLDRGSGAILAVTSVTGLVPAPYQNVYSASKHAVQAFMEGLSREYRGRGVSICTFAAGSMATEMIIRAGLDRKYATGSPVYLNLLQEGKALFRARHFVQDRGRACPDRAEAADPVGHGTDLHSYDPQARRIPMTGVYITRVKKASPEETADIACSPA
jgi:NAD(P)-dependent dehydrogenase (short-subunit alcohol dehydrogenase family)